MRGIGFWAPSLCVGSFSFVICCVIFVFFTAVSVLQSRMTDNPTLPTCGQFLPVPPNDHGQLSAKFIFVCPAALVLIWEELVVISVFG